MRRSQAKGRSGATLVELLVAGVILTMAVIGWLAFWGVAFNFSIQSDDTGSGYNLGRIEVERLKNIGFYYLTDGTQTRYYKQTTTGIVYSSTPSGMHYQVITTIATGRLTGSTDSSFTASSPPTELDIRRIHVVVTSLRTSQVIFDTITYMSQGGV